MRTSSRIVRCLFAAALALTLLPTAARADGFGIGVKGGFLYSNLSFSNANDVFNAKSGWQAGVFFASKRAIGALVEFNYLEKRAVDAQTGAKTTLQYIDLPTLLKVNIGSGSANGLSFYVAGGPTFDFKVGESISNQALVQSYEHFDFGLVGAARIELTRILIEVRGQWGLRNIAANQVAGGDLHSRSFAILFGLRFH